jgi:hypothetical protein
VKIHLFSAASLARREQRCRSSRRPTDWKNRPKRPMKSSNFFVHPLECVPISISILEHYSGPENLLLCESPLQSNPKLARNLLQHLISPLVRQFQPKSDHLASDFLVLRVINTILTNLVLPVRKDPRFGLDHPSHQQRHCCRPTKEASDYHCMDEQVFRSHRCPR